jgi:hypothetical protein
MERGLCLENAGFYQDMSHYHTDLATTKNPYKITAEDEHPLEDKEHMTARLTTTIILRVMKHGAPCLAHMKKAELNLALPAQRLKLMLT